MRSSRFVTLAKLSLFLLVLLPGISVAAAAAEPVEDKAALLDFKSKLEHCGGRSLNWNDATPVCSAWVGVVCDCDGSSVVELRLPAVGLYGDIPACTIGRLKNLQVLSLRSNRLTGNLPPDVLFELKSLRELDLQHNQLSGPLPTSLTQLVRLDLSFNNFSSYIPFALSGLRRLSLLDLRNNSFCGPIPNLDLPRLTTLDVSNNRLNGSIPDSLTRFGAATFAGNPDLCGNPLPDCEPPLPAVPARRKGKKALSTGAVAALVVGASALVIVSSALAITISARCRSPGRMPDVPEQDYRPPQSSWQDGGVPEKKEDYVLQDEGKPREDYPPQSSSQEEGREPKENYPLQEEEEPEQKEEEEEEDQEEGGEERKNELVFMEGCAYSFDVEDLLKASAEVLGKTSVGTSYKAVLQDGTAVVVKRLKYDVGASREDFEQRIYVVDRVRHANLLPLRAFYYSTDEKLLVFDYLPTGSLSALLHGSRSSGTNPLNWETRKRVALGAAQGIAQIHRDPSLVHGNIKSSNILLKYNLDAVVADFGLTPFFCRQSRGAAGYRAPEAVSGGSPTHKSDVYSFGVMLLELLTGKSPETAVDLPGWVQSRVHEEWTAKQVFDEELVRLPNSNEQEMVQLLQIALACVASEPDQRPSMAEVASMIQDMPHSSASQENNNNNNNNNRNSSNNGGQDSWQEAATSTAAQCLTDSAVTSLFD